MKFEIMQYSNGHYFLVIYNYYVLDNDIARCLNLSLKKYLSILRKNGARKQNSYSDYEFLDKKDAQQTIELLEPYLILANLTGE